jgi:hypothetical protein
MGNKGYALSMVQITQEYDKTKENCQRSQPAQEYDDDV